MELYVSQVGRRWRAELMALLDHPFAQRCGTLLQTVFPEIVEPPARSELDRAGIDHCSYAEGTDNIMLVFQCKGFQVDGFGSSQMAQCLHSIKTFAESPFKSKHYFLVVNRIVKGEYREKLEAAVQTLVAEGKVETAQLLGIEAFLKLIFQEAQQQTLTLLHSSAKQFQERHRARMSEDVYVKNVPFQLHGEVGLKIDPLDYVGAQISRIVSEPNNSRKWIFLSGEFGFGKTSFALRLPEILEKHKINCVYLPVAQFHQEAFEFENKFMREALQIVLQEELDTTSERHQLLQLSLKEIFKREKRVVLIFDGLDEHPICWRENGLKSVFGIFKTFNVSCLFTVRDEFLAERTGHFEAAIKGGPGSIMIRLAEWPDPLILEYSNLYKQTITESEAKERIGHFEDVVSTGRYVDYYGDIPHRPLFLKMLLDDVSVDDLHNRNLSELYSIYISQKFDVDRESSTSTAVVSRPLSSDKDREVVCSQLFDVMTLASGRMYSVENGDLLIDPRLDEEKLQECSHIVSDGNLDLPSIFLNSVMVPVGRRDRNRKGGRIQVAFAHSSFQEFFLARFILHVLLNSKADQTIVRCNAPKPVRRFLRGLVASLQSDEQDAVRSRCSEIRGDLILLT